MAPQSVFADSPSRFAGFKPSEEGKLGSGRDLGTGNPDAVGGEDCNGMGFDGSLFCLERRKNLTQSDHHILSVSTGLGLGVISNKLSTGMDGKALFEDGKEGQSEDALKKASIAKGRWIF